VSLPQQRRARANAPALLRASGCDLSQMTADAKARRVHSARGAGAETACPDAITMLLLFPSVHRPIALCYSTLISKLAD